MRARVLSALLCLALLHGAARPTKAETARPASAPARQYLDRGGSLAYSLVDGYPLRDKDGTVLAEVTLRLASPVVPLGGQLQLEWTLSNAQPRGTYLNPGLHRRVVQTGELIFFDRKGRYLPPMRGEGSYIAVDWISLQPGEKFTASRAYRAGFPRGRYCVQFVYWKQLLQPMPDLGLPPVATTQPFGPFEELFRSNPVWFDIVDPERGPATRPVGEDGK